jgi:hypothetical protein
VSGARSVLQSGQNRLSRNRDRIATARDFAHAEAQADINALRYLLAPGLLAIGRL